MTNIAGLISVVLSTNLLPVRVEQHYLQYQQPSGLMVRKLVHEQHTVLTNAPVMLVNPPQATNRNGDLYVTGYTNVIVNSRIKMFTNLGTNRNADVLATMDCPCALEMLPSSLRNPSLHAIPPILRAPRKVVPPPPAPPGMVTANANIPVVDVGIHPVNYGTNRWKITVNTGGPYGGLMNEAVTDWQNFQTGTTYALELTLDPIKGPWHVSYQTVWDFGTNDYWRVAQPSSGTQSHPMQFVRFRSVP